MANPHQHEGRTRVQTCLVITCLACTVLAPVAACTAAPSQAPLSSLLLLDFAVQARTGCA